MIYNFDKEIERRGTNSLKYDFAVQRGRPADILPLWVADMDFQCPLEVRQAVEQCGRHGIFGYSESGDAYFEAASLWFLHRHQYAVQKEWLVKTPGVIFAVVQALRAFTEPGDSVLIQQPVYYPFRESIETNGRITVNNPLKLVNSRYEIDFEDFERNITEHNVKLFILCSPHNPVGRVWTRDELKRMGDICLAHNVVVVSDEIHADFTYPGYTHTVFSTVSPEFQKNSVICTSPSKTFNLAGLQCSNIWIADRTLRRAFKESYNASGYSQLNTVGLAACESAYRHGSEWLDQLKKYLHSSLEYVRSFLKKNIPSVSLIEPQGTYLIWLDFSRTGLSDDEIHHRIEHEAGLWLDDGLIFGSEGSHFQRINIACPRPLLTRALSRLAEVFGSYV